MARLTEDLKQIKSSVADLQVEAKTISSENNIAVSKVQKLQGESNSITTELNITRINKEEAKEQIQKLKSVISSKISILDNKCPESVEILRKR